MSRRTLVFVGDFETTVYKGQKRTDVWASALTRLFDETDHVEVFSSLPETYEWICNNIHQNIIIYYHNLKFDGAFWISYLLERGDYVQAFEETESVKILEGTKFEKELKQGEFIKDKDMLPGTFKYLVSDMGAWYTVKIKRHDGYIIELRDSLKLIPCSVKQMGKDFQTKHQKTEIEYVGYRVPGGYISTEEKEYIANDVLVPKEVLEIMYNAGHKKLTIGACALDEFKNMVGCKPKHFSNYDDLFPRLDTWKIDEDVFGCDNADRYIRNSYRGGWCWYDEDIQNKLQGKGITVDVNSLYPSVMSGESGNKYPYGYPTFFTNKEDFEDIEHDDNKYYFIRVRTRFYLKDGYLPFIQIKRNKLYKSTEMLKTSDVYEKKTGRYLRFLRNREGNCIPTSVEITFSKTDWELVNEHYRLEDLEILDGCWFNAKAGLFDCYIDKYRQIKETSTGAPRTIAKRFLNTLYGQMARGTNSSFKVISLDEDGAITSEIIFENKKEVGYIADGAAITSYARAFTIREAQRHRKFFCYADTDSLHLNCTPEDAADIPQHETKFLHWKLESKWDHALFVRQKTYAEHVVERDGKKVKPFWDIKCAGLPDKCKKLFVLSLEGIDNNEEYDKIKEKLTDRERKFVQERRTIEDFKQGLKIPGKLLPVHIPGGVVLADVDFTLH